jgi:hypothetical protein
MPRTLQCGCTEAEGGTIVERGNEMQNPMAFEVHYSEYQRQAAWINENDWQFENAEERHPVRRAVAKALIALAARLSPAVAMPGTGTRALAR